MGSTSSRPPSSGPVTSGGGARPANGCEPCPTCSALQPLAARARCHRCGRRCCLDCVALRRYGSSTTSPAALFPVCSACTGRPNIIAALPRSVWRQVQACCDEALQTRLLQLCRAAQMGVALPYGYGRFGWASFFAERDFISRGANGDVFRTHVLPCIPAGLWEGDGTAVAAVGRPAAIKSIRKSSVFSMRAWSKMHREVDALRRCRGHRNVVRLLFVAQGPSEVYVALSYAAGGDLFDWLVRQQVPCEAEVGAIALQLLRALEELHERRGVVHRDVKPENLLVDEDEDTDDGRAGARGGLHIRLADFGYAKILLSAADEDGGPDATDNENISSCGGSAAAAAPGFPPLPPLLPSSAARAVPQGRGQGQGHGQGQGRGGRRGFMAATPCGTLGFAAPEILSAYAAQKVAEAAVPFFRVSTTSTSGGGNASLPLSPGRMTSARLLKRMDIFAAGVTIAILLTGCEPFPCTSSHEHLLAVRRGVDFSGPQWLHVSRAARLLLRSMLAPRAADRPSAAECLQSRWLEQFCWDGGVSTDGADGSAPSVSRDEVVHSFRGSVGSLRKNDGWCLVQTTAGDVAAVPREDVNSGDLQPPPPPCVDCAGVNDDHANPVNSKAY